MVRGCSECGRKLRRGLIPNTCPCDRFYCDECWDNFFKQIRPFPTAIYRQIRNENNEIEYQEVKEIYHIDTEYIPQCDQCGTLYQQQDTRYHEIEKKIKKNNSKYENNI
jgi:hypothetical protein